MNPNPLAVIPAVFEQFSAVVAAQSTRLGGVSAAPFDSLNLGKNTGDAPESVAENRRRLCESLGFLPQQLAWAKQVHGCEIRQVKAPGGADGFDSLITDVPGIPLGVSVADCTPILVYDRQNKAVAAIHAGWRGAAAQIVAKTLRAMRDAYGTEGEHCWAYVGACISECSYEVGEEVAAEFDSPFKRFDADRQRFFVDLKKANAAQLADFGVPEGQIEISPHCTYLQNDLFFSHRKDGGATGRGMGVVGMMND
jgi:uncharacterized protein, YfiH family